MRKRVAIKVANRMVGTRYSQATLDRAAARLKASPALRAMMQEGFFYIESYDQLLEFFHSIR